VRQIGYKRQTGYNRGMIIEIPVPPDFSFSETLSAHGWRRLAPFTWDEAEQTLERVEELQRGVVLLRLRDLEGRVLVDIQGRVEWNDTTEDEVVGRVQRMLQLDLPIDGFHTYCASHSELAHIAGCRRGRMLRGSTLYEDAVKVVATTNTTWAQTIAMSARLVEHFGAPLPGDPARHAFPTPRHIAAVPFEEFAAKARMGYRNAYVHGLATAITDGTLDLEAWQDKTLTADVLRKRLLSLPGIGPYGAACLMLYLGRPEHVNADSVARASLGKELGRVVTDKDVHDFFADHGPWRGLVYNFYPWRQ